MKRFLINTFLAIAISAIITEVCFAADKVDKRVYSKFNLHVSEDLAVGKVYSAKKDKPILTLPVHAKRMVSVASPTEYQGLGNGLGVMGPKKLFRITSDMKFFEVFSEAYSNIFCEAGRYKHFDNCLIDADGDGMFESGANKHANEGFAPGKVFHEATLTPPVAYTNTDTLMPVNFMVFYGGGKSRPKLTSILRDTDDNYIPAFLSPTPSKPAKGETLPYILNYHTLKLKILSRENKVMNVEIIEISEPIISFKVDF